jgi:hypothetical protein
MLGYMESIPYLYYTIKRYTMSKKLKKLEKNFDIEYLVDMAMDSLKDGDSIEEMLRWVLASAKADEWLECTHPEVACADKEYDGDKVIFTEFQYWGK